MLGDLGDSGTAVCGRAVFTGELSVVEGWQEQAQ
jgi:hypothetical protein